MADGGNTVPRITKSEHIGPDDTGDNIQAKRVAAYVWNGSEWSRMAQPGETIAYRSKLYDDGTYVFECEAEPGTALSDAEWRITRYDSDGSATFAGSAATFVNAATDLTTVQGYIYGQFQDR